MQKPSSPSSFCLSPEQLDSHQPTPFELTVSAEMLSELARSLDLLGLAKLRFSGQIAPEGKQDWRLSASLGATATQACVATLAPVKTRIEEQVTRRYVPADSIQETTEETETELDDEVEPIPDHIDLLAVVAEALTLALPDYPRAPDAPQDPQIFGPDGVAPMTDEDARPFAGLAALKDKLPPN